jgi:hypothetical protein
MRPINKVRDLWLAYLLRRAAAEMRRRGSQDIPYTEFRTTRDFAEFLDAAASRFRRGDTSDGETLWNLFAPTCSWDDASGSQSLGNLIYGAVGRRFFPKSPPPSSSQSHTV